MPDIVIHVIASAAYVGLAWHFWNMRWQRRTTIAQAAPSGLRSWERAALLAPLALHGWILYSSIVGEAALRFGFAQALSATVRLGVAIYWLESFFMHLDGLEPLLLPAAAAALFLPMAFPGRVSPQSFGNAEFAFHVLFFILAFGVLTIAIVHVAMLSFLERDLHRVGGGAAPRLPSLPPVLTLERLLFHLIALSFVLLTIGLAVGVALSESLFGRAMRFDHKTLFSLLAWLTLAVLLVGRHAYGWRGRTALRWTTAGFIFLLLAYVGRSFVLEVLLGRS
ncbi:MAG TPA: cytochrome c biogenesis protein CcsA [Burkholderiales bacterium]